MAHRELFDQPRARSARHDRRVAASICRPCAMPTTAARNRAAFMASSRVNCSISSLRSCGNSSRTNTCRSNKRSAAIRSPRCGDRWSAPSSTRRALSLGIRVPGIRGAVVRTASFTSMRHMLPSPDCFPATARRTAIRRRPSELHPFTQYAASRTSTDASSSRVRSVVASLHRRLLSNSARTARVSLADSGQNRLPSGIVGFGSSMRSLASCFQVRLVASRSTTRTESGR